MNRTLIVAALLGALAGPAGALSAKLAPGSAVWLEGDSTLHAFASTSTAVGFSMTLPGEDLAAAVKAGSPAAMTVTIPVETLKSGKDGLDKNLYKALKRDDKSDIVFTLASYKPAADLASLEATGTLDITGKALPVTLKAALKKGADGRLSVTGSHEMLMTEYGIKPPKLMMGAVKVADKVVVRFRLELEKAADEQKAANHK